MLSAAALWAQPRLPDSVTIQRAFDLPEQALQTDLPLAGNAVAARAWRSRENHLWIQMSLLREGTPMARAVSREQARPLALPGGRLGYLSGGTSENEGGFGLSFPTADRQYRVWMVIGWQSSETNPNWRDYLAGRRMRFRLRRAALTIDAALAQ